MRHSFFPSRPAHTAPPFFSRPAPGEEAYCVKQARSIQTKGAACDVGNTNYRGDTDSTINLSCPDLKKKVRGERDRMEPATPARPL